MNRGVHFVFVFVNLFAKRRYTYRVIIIIIILLILILILLCLDIFRSRHLCPHTYIHTYHTHTAVANKPPLFKSKEEVVKLLSTNILSTTSAPPR